MAFGKDAGIESGSDRGTGVPWKHRQQLADTFERPVFSGEASNGPEPQEDWATDQGAQGESEAFSDLSSGVHSSVELILVGVATFGFRAEESRLLH